MYPSSGHDRATPALIGAWTCTGLALLIVVVQAGVLALEGRPAGCPCGATRLWGAIAPGQNSQHWTDAYSWLHFGFGLGLVVFFAHIRPRWRRRDWMLLALVCSAIWEAVENLPVMIDSFGYAADDALRYGGDSIANSLGDSMFVMAGAGLGLAVPVSVAVAFALALEVGVTLAIGDGYATGLLRALGALG